MSVSSEQWFANPSTAYEIDQSCRFYRSDNAYLQWDMDESYGTWSASDDGTLSIGSYSYSEPIGVQWTPSTTANLVSVQLDITAVSTAGTTTMYLFADDSGSPASSSLATSAAKSLGTGTQTWTWSSPPTVTASTTYWVVLFFGSGSNGTAQTVGGDSDYGSAKSDSGSGQDQTDLTVGKNMGGKEFKIQFNTVAPPVSNTDVGTISVWLKRGDLGIGNARVWDKGDGTLPMMELIFTAADKLMINGDAGGGLQSTSTRVFRDIASWYHVVTTVDTSQAVAANRTKLYVNGTQITDWDSETWLDQNDNVFTGTDWWIGRWANPVTNYNWDGYLAEVVYIDGTAYGPSDFGETDSTTGQWIPKDVSELNFGNQGFWLDFADSSALGNDISGNDNDFTPSNLAAADQMTDSPTDNFCLWNAVGQGTSTGGSNYSTLSNGNLVATASGSDYNWSFGTIKPSSGKWYWEITLTTDNGSNWVGVAQDLLKSSAAGDDSGFGSVNGFGYRDSNGNKINDSGTSSSYGATYTAGDVIGVAMDLDNGKIWFSKDGTYQDSGDPAAGSDAAFETLSGSYAPCIQQSSASAVFTANFGQSSFSTAAPTGFSALSTANLPDPTIAKPSEYFSTVLYAGDGSDGYEVTGVGFEPDMFWLKNRAAAENHYVFDSVRGVGTGAGKHISPNDGTAEVSDATVKAITSDGFTVEATGAAINTGNHVVWSWLEDATSGFDIVSYTGNGSNRTISHSLGAVPGQMIIKNLDTEIDWAVYNEGSLWHGAANLGYLTLNTTAVSYDNDEYWNDTTPTSSVFTVGTHNSVNKDSSPMIAYLWAGVEGFSSFGKYEGNGSTDGPFILTGFKPRFIVCKSYSGAKGWNMFDSARSTYNVAGAQLQANLDEAEATLNAVDLLSNGFKLRTADNAVNRNGYGFIYMAWAESSFKYATAR